MRLHVHLLTASLATLTTLGATAAEEPSPVCKAVTHKQLDVSGKNDEWTSAGTNVRTGDLVLVLATGKVKLGEAAGEASPSGAASGEGMLTLKVGTSTVVPVGARWVGTFAEGGAVKFRVAATDRSTSSGKYAVNLVVIPYSALPAAVKVDTEFGEGTPAGQP